MENGSEVVEAQQRLDAAARAFQEEPSLGKPFDLEFATGDPAPAMKILLLEWLSLASSGTAVDDTWISKIRVEHHGDHELVGWVNRDAEESTEDFGERIYAMAENDAEALGSGDQLYMLRVYQFGDAEPSARRPLRIFYALPAAPLSPLHGGHSSPQGT
jgi:hypothetical protein